MFCSFSRLNSAGASACNQQKQRFLSCIAENLSRAYLSCQLKLLQGHMLTACLLETATITTHDLFHLLQCSKHLLQTFSNGYIFPYIDNFAVDQWPRCEGPLPGEQGVPARWDAIGACRQRLYWRHLHGFRWHALPIQAPSVRAASSLPRPDCPHLQPHLQQGEACIRPLTRRIAVQAASAAAAAEEGILPKDTAPSERVRPHTQQLHEGKLAISCQQLVTIECPHEAEGCAVLQPHQVITTMLKSCLLLS